MQLRDLIEQHGGSGFIRISSGAGSTPPTWILWDRYAVVLYGAISMAQYPPETQAYDDARTDTTISDIVKLATKYPIWDSVYASDWIDGLAGFRYRIIFYGGTT